MRAEGKSALISANYLEASSKHCKGRPGVRIAFDREFGAAARLGVPANGRSARKTESDRRGTRTERERTLLSELGQLDSLWTESPAQCRESLAQIALRLTFVQKWLSEVRERKIRLEELA